MYWVCFTLLAREIFTVPLRTAQATQRGASSSVWRARIQCSITVLQHHHSPSRSFQPPRRVTLVSCDCQEKGKSYDTLWFRPCLGV